MQEVIASFIMSLAYNDIFLVWGYLQIIELNKQVFVYFNYNK